MTDDHEWVVLVLNDGRVLVHTFNGMEFLHKETLAHQSSSRMVSPLSLTNDHQYMAFVIDYNAYVYKYDGGNFTLYAAISNTSSHSAVYITEDHQLLTLAGGSNNFSKVYNNTASGF